MSVCVSWASRRSVELPVVDEFGRLYQWLVNKLTFFLIGKRFEYNTTKVTCTHNHVLNYQYISCKTKNQIDSLVFQWPFFTKWFRPRVKSPAKNKCYYYYYYWNNNLRNVDDRFVFITPPLCVCVCFIWFFYTRI